MFGILSCNSKQTTGVSGTARETECTPLTTKHLQSTGKQYRTGFGFLLALHNYPWSMLINMPRRIGTPSLLNTYSEVLGFFNQTKQKRTCGTLLVFRFQCIPRCNLRDHSISTVRAHIVLPVNGRYPGNSLPFRELWPSLLHNIKIPSIKEHKSFLLIHSCCRYIG